MAEIYLNSNPGEGNFKVQSGLKKEFEVDNSLTIIELLFMLFDPNHLPGVITLRCIVDGAEQKVDIWTVTMGISTAEQNGVIEKTPAKLSYTDSLAALYQLALEQSAKKKTPVKQETPINLTDLELAFVGDSGSGDGI